MGFYNWLKNLFRKKELKIEYNDFLQQQAIIPDYQTIDKRKRKEQDNKEYPKLEETKNLSKHKEFQNLVENIEVNRESIIKAQEETNIPKIKEYNDRVEYIFRGITFIFCKEGYKLFKEEFNDNYHHIIVNKGYLAREHNGHSFPYFLDIKDFHRWFMEDEVKEFAEINNCPPENIHVHHIDLTTTNNKKENLKVITIEEHKKLHYRLKFDGTDKEFEEWYSTLLD